MWNHYWSWNESVPSAARLDIKARIAIRVNPSEEAQGGAMRMGGKAVPFGIDEEKLDAVIERVVFDSALEFRGIHLFSGTQILDHMVLARQFRKGIEIALGVARRLERPLRTVDFGGGLGIPYFPGEAELDMESLRREDQMRSCAKCERSRYFPEPDLCWNPVGTW